MDVAYDPLRVSIMRLNSDPKTRGIRDAARRVFKLVNAMGFTTGDLTCLIVFLPNSYNAEKTASLLRLCEKTVYTMYGIIFSKLRRKQLLSSFLDELSVNVLSYENCCEESRFALATAFDAVRLIRERVSGHAMAVQEYQFAMRSFGLPMAVDTLELMSSDNRISTSASLEKLRCSRKYNLLHLYKNQAQVHRERSAYLYEVIAAVRGRPSAFSVFDARDKQYKRLIAGLQAIGVELEDVHALCADLERDNGSRNAARDLHYMHGIVLFAESAFQRAMIMHVLHFLQKRRVYFVRAVAEFALVHVLASLYPKDWTSLDSLMEALLRLEHIGETLSDFWNVISMDASRHH
eukprot:3938357-Rhodomonas_salina.3